MSEITALVTLIGNHWEAVVAVAVAICGFLIGRRLLFSGVDDSEFDPDDEGTWNDDDKAWHEQCMSEHKTRNWD